MARGIITFLTGSDPRAAVLRSRYVFKIVPMMNPDGVVCGNTRCTLAGDDLNRQWRYPDKTKHSVLIATKLLMEQFTKERSVVLHIDLHAHSRRCNLFSYGCPIPKTKLVSDPSIADMERVFPHILAETCEAFRYGSCSYKTYGKEDTSRVVLNTEFNIAGSYTIEASFLGGDFGNYDGAHYTTADYMSFGKDILVAVLDFSDKGAVERHLAAVRADRGTQRSAAASGAAAGAAGDESNDEDEADEEDRDSDGGSSEGSDFDSEIEEDTQPAPPPAGTPR